MGSGFFHWPASVTPFWRPQSVKENRLGKKRKSQKTIIGQRNGNKKQKTTERKVHTNDCNFSTLKNHIN